MILIAWLALAAQVASASWWREPYRMPNVALVIAYNLATSGQFEGGSWIRLKGTESPSDPPLRAYHLPGAPLYFAAGLALHQPRVFKYWQVPVTVVLIVAVAACALALFGPDVALLTGIIAALDPVTVIHGPVYDDTFLGAALIWSVGAILMGRWVLARPVTERRVDTTGSWWTAALALGAGWAAITRSELFVALSIASLCCLVIPRLSRLRRAGAAMCLGIVLAMGGWVARNAMVVHAPITGSTHDGLTLWESTAPHTVRSLSLGQVDALSTDPAIVEPLWRQTAGAGEAEANRVFWRAALQNMASAPGRVAALAARKIALSWLGIRPDLSWWSARNGVSVAVSLLLSVAALLGWRRSARQADAISRVPALAAYGIIVEGLVVLALGPVGVRYWIAARPILWILAAQAVRPS